MGCNASAQHRVTVFENLPNVNMLRSNLLNINSSNQDVIPSNQFSHINVNNASNTSNTTTRFFNEGDEWGANDEHLFNVNESF